LPLDDKTQAALNAGGGTLIIVGIYVLQSISGQATLAYLLIGVGLAVYVIKEIPGGKPPDTTKDGGAAKPAEYEAEKLPADTEQQLQEIEQRIRSGWEYVATAHVGERQRFFFLRRKKA